MHIDIYVCIYLFACTHMHPNICIYMYIYIHIYHGTCFSDQKYPTIIPVTPSPPALRFVFLRLKHNSSKVDFDLLETPRAMRVGCTFRAYANS